MTIDKLYLQLAKRGLNVSLVFLRFSGNRYFVSIENPFPDRHTPFSFSKHLLFCDPPILLAAGEKIISITPYRILTKQSLFNRKY